MLKTEHKSSESYKAALGGEGRCVCPCCVCVCSCCISSCAEARSEAAEEAVSAISPQSVSANPE